MPDDITATLSVTTTSTDITMVINTDHTGTNADYPKDLLSLNRRDRRAAMKKRGILYQQKWDRLGYL